MKTLSKVLSMLLVIVMCVSLFGANAYASGLAPLNGGSQGGLAPLAPINESGNDVISNDDNIDDFTSGTPLAPLGTIGDVTTQSIDDNQLKPIENGNLITPFSLEDVAKVGNTLYRDFGDAFAQLQSNGGVLELYANITDISAITDFSLTKNATINLNGNTLALGSSTFDVKSGVVLTIQNGTITNDASIANVADTATVKLVDVDATKAAFTRSGTATRNISIDTKCRFSDNSDWNDLYVPNGYTLSTEQDKDGFYTIVSASQPDQTVLINKSSGKKYTAAEIADAFSAANAGNTLEFVNVSAQGTTYTITDEINIIRNVTINLNNNGIDATFNVDGKTVSSVVLTGSGYVSKIVCNDDGKATTLTLKNTVRVDAVELYNGDKLVAGGSNVGTVTAAAKSSVDVSGSVTIEELRLTGGTLKMTSGTINKLTIADTNTLTVSGGVIGDFDASGATKNNQGLSGGTWNGVDETDLQFLKDSCVKGYAPRGGGGQYVIEKDGVVTPTPSQNPGQTTGKFTVYNGRYVKGSNTRVYITESTGNQLDGLWIGPYYMNTANTENITAYTDSYYSPIYIDNSYLDSLSAGTYYLYTNYTNVPNDPKYVGQLTILNSNGGGTNIPDYDGPLQVGTRYENDWYQGDDALQFYVTPYPGGSKTGTNMKVYIDGRTVGNLDYYDYLNGYFYIGTAKLSSIGSGTHWLTVENTKTGETGSCTFYVGPTLRARDTNKHVTGSSKDLKFVCSEPISRVWVGDKELDNYDSYDYYTLSRDGKTVTLTARFLNNRTAGNTYTLTVETNTGERVSTSFQILTTAQASSSPKTGDNSNLALWISALVMSGAAAAVIVPSMKRKENEG